MKSEFLQIHKKSIDTPTVDKLRNCILTLLSHYSKNKKVSLIDMLMDGNRTAESNVAIRSVLEWFWRSPFPEIFWMIHREPPVLILNFLTIRNHSPASDATHVPWHADVNIAGAAGPLTVCWVPLDPVGETAPSLEFCIPRDQAPEGKVHERWSRVATLNGTGLFSDEDLDLLYGADRYRRECPVLDPGDFLVFDRYLVHRTQKLERPTTGRIAVEFRVASSRRPPRDIPGDENLTVSTFRRDTNEMTIAPASSLYKT